MNSKRTTTSNGYEFLLPVSKNGWGHVVVLDGDQMKFRKVKKDRAGGNGFGVSTNNECFTLNTIDRHIVGIFK